MAAGIREAAVAMRHQIEWGRWNTGVGRICAEFAIARMYSLDPGVRRATFDALRGRLLRAVAREYMTDAVATGKAAATPIIQGLKGQSEKIQTTDDVRKALRLTGAAAAWHRDEIAAIRRLFAAELKGASAGLSAQAEAAFIRARNDAVRNGEGVRGLAEAMAKADRSMLRADLQSRQKIREATKVLRDAERAGDAEKASDAHKELTKAQRAGKRSSQYTFLERFETQIRGQARNAIRRTIQQTQQAYFYNAGYGARSLYTYVASNGDGACPICANRHGDTKTEMEWRGEGPAEGTYCGDSCCCMLVPEHYAASKSSLKDPLSLDRPPKTDAEPSVPAETVAPPKRQAARPKPQAPKPKPKPAKPKAAPKPSKVGGENARLAKEAKKRAAEREFGGTSHNERRAARVERAKNEAYRRWQKSGKDEDAQRFIRFSRQQKRASETGATMPRAGVKIRADRAAALARPDPAPTPAPPPVAKGAVQVQSVSFDPAAPKQVHIQDDPQVIHEAFAGIPKNVSGEIPGVRVTLDPGQAGGGVYQFGEIRMSPIGMSKRDMASVFRHEYGHHADLSLGLSKSPEFRAAFREAQKTARTSPPTPGAKRSLSSQVKLADLTGSLTGGKDNSGMAGQIHTKEYYDAMDHRAPAEAFAISFDGWIGGDAQMMKSYPSLVKYFEARFGSIE